MRITGKNIIIFILLFMLGIFAFLFILGRGGMNEVSARDLATAGQQKYFTSIEVKEGDTLWSIASEYMSDEYKDRNEFMDEVRQMNHITGSVIRAGSRLFIPYYSE